MWADSEGTAGRSVEVSWRGRPVHAWVPAPLSRRDLTLTTATVRAAERAVADLRLADARLPPTWEPLARLLLRHEGMASSRIEGLREPVEAVLLAERTGAGGAAGWVADNLAVMDMALRSATEPLTVEAMHHWHVRLMRHSRLPDRLHGAFRASPGWVGGQSPVDAAYVPPPPSEIERLIDDLVLFANAASAGDAISHAAVTHAQFEAIHPYSDGNGRIGRVLVSRMLRRAGVTARSPAPISMAIARDPGGYLSGLRLFEQGDVDPWVRWFAETATRAAHSGQQIIAEANRLLDRWADTTAELRSNNSARALLSRLPASPVLSAPDVADLLGVSERSGRSALKALADHGILRPIADTPTSRPGRTRQWYAADELLNLWSP